MPFDIGVAPLSQATRAGTPITLSAAPSDTNSYSFQWLWNGTAVGGETNPLLSLGALERTNSGWYTLVVSNNAGQSVQLNALLRALVPPILQPPQLLSNSVAHLLFQDSDGGLPYDITKVKVQWRTNLNDISWQGLTNIPYSNGTFIAIDDTNAIAPNKFYRVLEQ